MKDRGCTPRHRCLAGVPLFCGRGFTLLEMLVVTVILSVVSLALYATFSSGISIWQKTSVSLPQEEIGILFDRFTSDLRNAVRYQGMGFSGDGEKLEVPTLVSSRIFQGRVAGKTRYVYSERQETLTREQRDIAQVYGSTEGSNRQVVANVSSLRFRYYRYAKERSEYVWEDEWAGEGFPLAVRMEFEFDDGRGVQTFAKTVTIPIGG